MKLSSANIHEDVEHVCIARFQQGSVEYFSEKVTKVEGCNLGKIMQRFRRGIYKISPEEDVKVAVEVAGCNVGT